MTERQLVRWSGLLVAMGGLAIAAYMLIHPWAQRTGAIATSPQWVLSHGFHFLGALFLQLGLIGVYLRQKDATGRSGLIGFVLAFLGTALFVGTGMTSTFLWPAVAAEAPTFVAPDGGMFNHPLALGPILAARIFLVLGFAWLAIVSFRAGILPRIGSVIVLIGVVATNLPTEPVGPVPWSVSVIGGVVFCLGLLSWGHALWTGATAAHEAPIRFLAPRRVAVAIAVMAVLIGTGGTLSYSESIQSCFDLAAGGLRHVATDRSERFLGKVGVPAARCRGGDTVEANQELPWVDWGQYYGTRDGSSLSSTWLDPFLLGQLERPGRGIDGALMDLEYQRLELIQFNLFDNSGTYAAYLTGRGGDPGPSLRWWPTEMRLRPDHAHYQAVGGDGEQVCAGELVRGRTLTGICNDVRNPAMGSSGMPFARNVQFEATFPTLRDSATDHLAGRQIAHNRHGERIDLLTPDPQLISRRLFTREQSDPAACNQGLGVPGGEGSSCDYAKAPFFNVLAAFWIQFMTHDWFSHLVEGQNRPGEMMQVGCSEEAARSTGCRPGDRIDPARVAQDGSPPVIRRGGREQLGRAYRTTDNNVTAWWDASQIYGYDETSVRRVKRDPNDRARLLMEPVPGHTGAGEAQGYLPVLADDDPRIPQWEGQEAVAFPDNFNIGLSFYHNVFAREHNAFVDHFRATAQSSPGEDSGLRRPDDPRRPVPYSEVTDEEIYQIARLVVSAEIAKIHTIEWTTQLLYNEPLYRGMNANWTGLFDEQSRLSDVSERIRRRLADSRDPDKSNLLVSLFASGSGIVGMGSRMGDPSWSIANPDDLNGGVTHFGSPFNFPEEFITVYRLHPLVPDLAEFRELAGDPNAIADMIPMVQTVRAGATASMRNGGLASWALSLGRQRLGLLQLGNHPQFLQNLRVPRLPSETGMIDVAALDLIRDRERGVPRFNEFRRQYGLRSFRSFDELAGQELAPRLREIYGTHVCDASKVITEAQRDSAGNLINDCLGHPDGTEVDNVEDVDAVVGWLAEVPSSRPHGFAISETQFQVFILNASRRLFSDRFFTSSFRPDIYSSLGYEWVMNNGPGEKQHEPGAPNGHAMQEVAPLKRVLLRTVPELAAQLEGVINTFDPWARNRGEYYCLDWKPRTGAESDPAFAGWQNAPLNCTERGLR